MQVHPKGTVDGEDKKLRRGMMVWIGSTLGAVKSREQAFVRRRKYGIYMLHQLPNILLYPTIVPELVLSRRLGLCSPFTGTWAAIILLCKDCSGLQRPS